MAVLNKVQLPKVPPAPKHSSLQVPPPPCATLLLDITDSHMAYRMAFTSNNTCTTARGGVCPARRVAWGGGGARARAYSRLHRWGNPWARKALFGTGRIAQSPSLTPPQPLC